MTERRRTFGPVVLLGLAAGTLTAVAGEKPAVEGVRRRGPAVSSRLVSFDAHLPLVTALGLVVLACWGVVLVTRGRVRRAVAVLAHDRGRRCAGGRRWRRTPRCPTSSATSSLWWASKDADLSHTAWYWVAVVGALLATVAGALAVAWAPAWPEMGTRYDAPGARRPDAGRPARGADQPGPLEGDGRGARPHCLTGHLNRMLPAPSPAPCSRSLYV